MKILDRLSISSAVVLSLCIGLLAVAGLPAAAAGADDAPGKNLATRWAKDVSPTNALAEYPRPGMTRGRWMNLNGSWDFSVTDPSPAPPQTFLGQILVPFPLESTLSGVRRPLPERKMLWYRRAFHIPADWNGRHTLLHFDAVNWQATAYLNGQRIVEHKGGYDGFSADITSQLKPGDNELVVSVLNPLIANALDAQVLGKQRRQPQGIFYTASTGIWQTVWLESVPAVHIATLRIVPDVDAKSVHVTVNVDGAPGQWVGVSVAASDNANTVATARGAAGIEMTLPIADPHLWSPDDPHLYQLHVAIARDDQAASQRSGDQKSEAAGGAPDAVDSYFAMRKISLGKDEQGHQRILLNDHFVFEVGALDQGYWPDGIYTAPTDAALKSDIEFAKRIGLNLLRKHAKVEPERWYYWADKLGILVWQDMPQAFGQGKSSELSESSKAQWLIEWKRILDQRMNHPSIIVWTTFNEGWGQHDTDSIVALTKQIDPSRLVNDASGWVDKGVGDIHDKHAYPGPACDDPSDERAVVNGEFGGVTMRVPGHMWESDVLGYGKTLTDARQVTRRYQELLKAAYGLRDSKACSAVVYTQLTDVERESNGLMTYDRAVVKPNIEIMTAANEGRFPRLPPVPATSASAPAPVASMPASMPTSNPAR